MTKVVHIDLKDVRLRSIAAQDTIPLRHTVLWPDKPLSHVLLPEDEDGHHFGAFLPGSDTPAAVISLFEEPFPSSVENHIASTESCARFRKFACHPSYQGHGIGSTLLLYTFDKARNELGCSTVWCDGRLETAAWYEKRGMTRFGSHFWKGHIEYVRMKIGL